jgi:hypothetical protein
MKTIGRPAFPIIATPGLGNEGLTKREYFAAAALTGLLTGLLATHNCDSITDAIQAAYKIADDMLQEGTK